MLGQSQGRQWLISYEYTCTASKTQEMRSFDRFFLCAGEKLWWIWCITRSAHLPPICSTCQCFVKVRMQKCCHVCIGANKILKNEGGKKPVKVLAYLCSAVVFVHICVISPGWVADSSWVPILFLLLQRNSWSITTVCTSWHFKSDQAKICCQSTFFYWLHICNYVIEISEMMCIHKTQC